MKPVLRFISRWQNLLALAIIGFYIFVAAAAPGLAPQPDPEDPSPYRIEKQGPIGSRTPLPPGPHLPLGAAPGGVDIYYALVWGAYPALRFGLMIALSAAALGVFLGATSGYFGGRFNSLVMRATDAFLAFPAIAGVFLFRQILLPASPDVPLNQFQRTILDLDISPVLLALILFSWMPYARLINANVLLLKQAEYVLAARTLGATHARIILSHLLPNGISPAIVLAARDVGAMVVLEASFTFIGLSGELPWGVLLVAGRNWIIGPGGNPLAYWWVFLPATLALILFGVGWNLIGDGLNRAMDPRADRKTG
ncbi:MAG: ABC transporter permease [Anaerolineales bacterium]|nr:ABC transporter permease [Anaerolineales bacterium]